MRPHLARGPVPPCLASTIATAWGGRAPGDGGGLDTAEEPAPRNSKYWRARTVHGSVRRCSLSSIG